MKKLLIAAAILLLSVYGYLSFKGHSISDERAIAMVENCYKARECSIVGDDKSLPPSVDRVQELTCQSAGKSRIFERVPYEGGEFIRLECHSSDKLISRTTVWNHFSGGVSVDIQPRKDKPCNFFQPI